MTRPQIFSNIIDAAVDPVRAIMRVQDAPYWRASLVLLSILMAIGMAAESPAQHRADLEELDKQLATTALYHGMSPQAIANMRFATLHPPGWQLPLLVTFQLIVVSVALLFVACILVWAAALAKTRTPFRVVWSAVVLGAVPSVGLSYVVAGTIALLVGSSYFTSYDRMDAIIPTAALFAPSGGFFKDALGAISPFVLWNLALDAVILRKLCKTSLRLSVGVAIALLAALGAFYGFSARL